MAAKPILICYVPYDVDCIHGEKIRESLIEITQNEYHVINVGIQIEHPRFEALLPTEEINIEQLHERIKEIVKNEGK